MYAFQAPPVRTELPRTLPASADAPLTSIDDLTGYFASACKAKSGWRLGVEHEKIAVTASGDPIPYRGPGGVVALLEALGRRGFRPRQEDENLIGAGRKGEEITLEPGLQVELSAPPVDTALACQHLLRAHTREVAGVAAELGIHFVSCGFHPWARLGEIPWLPKRRYVHMRAYLPRQGRHGHDMMKRTATVQVNHDFADEADAAEKLRAAMALSAPVSALYAASPVSEGQPNGHKSIRAAVWLDMDPARCGLIEASLLPGFGFRGYAEWAADVPLFFVARGGRYQAAPGFTFRRFMKEGWQGQRPTQADWALHLSTLFPEVRLKRTIEVRGADAGPLVFAEALPALWRGLLDDPLARREALALMEGASFAEHQELRQQVPRAGLAARFRGRALGPLMRELCAVAGYGLSRLPGGAADRALLDPLLEYARQSRCPADDMLDDFKAARGDRAKLVTAWRVR